jgi:cell division protein YceG involved in septum cleavage
MGKGIFPKIRNLFSGLSKKRIIRQFLTFSGLAFGILLAFYYFSLAPPGGEGDSKAVNIPAGKGFSDISMVLEAKGIVRSGKIFYLLGRLGGGIPKIKAGEYEFHPRMSPFEVLAKMV